LSIPFQLLAGRTKNDSFSFAIVMENMAFRLSGEIPLVIMIGKIDCEKISKLFCLGIFFVNPWYSGNA